MNLVRSPKSKYSLVAFVLAALLLSAQSLAIQFPTVERGPTSEYVLPGSTHIGRMLPVNLTVGSDTVQGGAESIPVTIELNSIPANGSTIQVNTDMPSKVVSPSGSWPYTHFVPGGSSNPITINFATNGVSSSTLVKVGACETGVDATNQSNWRVTDTATIVP